MFKSVMQSHFSLCNSVIFEFTALDLCYFAFAEFDINY